MCAISNMKNTQQNIVSDKKNNGNFIAWHHVRMIVPQDWEVTAYSVEDRAGRLEFNTRDGLQGIVSWEPCKREPDKLTTMATFIRNNILGKDKSMNLRTGDIRTQTAGEFLMGWLDDTGPCQALGYTDKGKHLVRWVFEKHASEKGRRDIIAPLLESFDFNDDELCEYALHGIRCTLPRDYKIEDIVILPANAMMTFESEDSKRRATFRRWGLAEMILDGMDMTDFYKSVLKTNGIVVDSAEPCRVNGMEGRIVRYNGPREHHSDRFMRRRWHNGIGVIWHDTDANRVKTFEQIGPDDTDALAFDATLPGLSVKK